MEDPGTVIGGAGTQKISSGLLVVMVQNLHFFPHFSFLVNLYTRNQYFQMEKLLFFSNRFNALLFALILESLK
jgi:hypothetical protein